MVLLLPLETVLMRRFGLWYCSARELSLEARASLGMKKDELWTPPLYAECCRVFESNKTCCKISPRALSLISMASNLTATMTIPTTNNNAVTNAGGVIEVVDTTEAEAQLVKKDQEEWRKILKPSLGKIKKSKRNKLPPPSSKSKRTRKPTVSKDIKVVTKAISSSKNNKQVKGESSTEGESDSNNEINETGFPISIIQFPTSSSDTKKSRSSKSSKKSSSTPKTSKSSSSKKTTKASTSTKPSKKAAISSTSTKDVKKVAVPPTVKTTTTMDKGVRRERSSASPTTTKKSQDSASVRQRSAVIKNQGVKIVERMVCKIPTTHWSSPMYSH